MTHAVGAVAHQQAGIGRLGGPDAPEAFGRRVALQFAQDGQGIGVAFVQLDQAQVMMGDLGQGAPTVQGLTLAGQRQAVETALVENLESVLQQCGSDLVIGPLVQGVLEAIQIDRHRLHPVAGDGAVHDSAR